VSLLSPVILISATKIGTKLPSGNVRAVVAIEGKADIKRMAKVEMHARDKGPLRHRICVRH